jgi:1,4-alpha-glucan branching enzyme
VPLLFMGEEWASSRPFQFFCDFSGALAEAVRDGRRREFARFPAFADPRVRKRIPDPNDPATFAHSKLDWNEAEQDSNDDHVQFCRKLLEVRRQAIAPRVDGASVGHASYAVTSEGPLQVSWQLADGAQLLLVANLRSDSAEPPSSVPIGTLLHSTHPRVPDDAAKPGWFVAWYLAGPEAAP